MDKKNVLIRILKGLESRPEYQDSEICLWIDDDEYGYVDETTEIPLAMPLAMPLVIKDLNEIDEDIPDFVLFLQPKFINDNLEGETVTFFNEFFDDANKVSVDYTDDAENDYSILSYLCGNIAPSFHIDELDDVFDFLNIFIGLHRTNRHQVNILSSFMKDIENYGTLEKEHKTQLLKELLSYQDKGTEFLKTKLN